MQSAKTSPNRPEFEKRSDFAFHQRVIEDWAGHTEGKRENAKAVAWIVICLIFYVIVPVLFFGGCLAGCTVAPRVVTESVASFDGNQQNSGFIGFTTNGAGIITPHARDRYNALVATYSAKFLPPLTADSGITPTATNTFLIDAEHLSDFGIMNHWRKQTLTPTPR